MGLNSLLSDHGGVLDYVEILLSARLCIDSVGVPAKRRGRRYFDTLNPKTLTPKHYIRGGGGALDLRVFKFHLVASGWEAGGAEHQA